MVHRRSSILTLLSAAILLTAGSAAASGHQTQAFALEDTQEVPPSGSGHGGTATLTLDPATRELCYDLVVDFTDASAAHIHEAPFGANGPIRVTLNTPTGGTSSGCTILEAALADALLTNPHAFYVNVHSPTYPAGDVRGQLGSWTPVPVPELGAVVLAGVGLALLAGVVLVTRRRST